MEDNTRVGRGGEPQAGVRQRDRGLYRVLVNQDQSCVDA